LLVAKEGFLITKEPSLVIKEVKSMKRQLASCIRLALQIAFRFFNLQKTACFFFGFPSNFHFPPK